MKIECRDVNVDFALLPLDPQMNQRVCQILDSEFQLWFDLGVTISIGRTCSYHVKV